MSAAATMVAATKPSFQEPYDHSHLDKDIIYTTPWENFISLLIALYEAIVSFFQSLFAPGDYMPRIYTPSNPTYWKAYKRNPKDIITNTLTAEVREKQANGELEPGLGDDEEKEEYDVRTRKREVETVSIRSFVSSRCPSLHKDYVPSWWLRNGHLNTIYCVIGDFTKKDLVEYDRTLLRLPDGGTIGLDFTPPSSERELDPRTPIVVVLHGLSGGSFESYVRDILSTTCASKRNGGLGYRAVVMNFRGCAGVPLTTAQLYGGAHTEDIRSTILYLRQTYPEAPLLGIGFSLGANVLALYVEEEGENCPLTSACTLGNPWNLNLNSDRLEKRWLSRNIYAKAMGGNLLFLLRNHLETLSKLAPTRATPHIEHLLTMRAPTLKDFDHHVTCWMGGTPPKFPFASADDYYAGSTTHKRTHEIKVPFIAFNTQDDPIVAENPIEEVENDGRFICQVVTPYGGHLGWFEGGTFGGLLAFGGPPPRWVRKPVLEWLQATGEDVADLGQGGDRGLKRKFNVLKNEKGFTMLEGSEVVGYKLLVKGNKVKQPEPGSVESHLQAAGSAA